MATEDEPEPDMDVGPSAHSTSDMDRYAADFAAAIPTEMYSIAQIQGYLLTKKHDPVGAMEGAAQWHVAQQTERRALLDEKRRWKAEIARQWQTGFDEFHRDMDAWERVVGENEERHPTQPFSEL